MSTRTDLTGALVGDEDNLTLRMSDFFAKHAGKTLVINVRWTPIGGSAPEKLNDDPILVEKAAPAGVCNLVEAVSKVITGKLGPSPAGLLRVQGYVKGESGNPGKPLDFSRTLVPADLSGLGDPNLTLVRGQLDQALRQNSTLHTLLVQLASANAGSLGQLAQANAQLATVRAAASAGADAGTLGTLIGIGAVLVMAPVIKRELGLPPNATLDQVLQSVRRQALSVAAADALEPPAPPPRAMFSEPPAPPGAGGGAGAGAGGPEAPEAAQGAAQAPPLPAGQVDLDQVLAQLRADPELRRQAFARAMQDPELKAAAEAAYFQGGT